jgi:hypothetical protein
MTSLHNSLKGGDAYPACGRHGFGRGDRPVRRTEAWEHETFAEEQARWERNDPGYAWICERVRQAKPSGGDASLRADLAKAEWDARAAVRRQVNDDAQRAHHALKTDPTARRPPATSSLPRKTRWKNGRETPRLVMRAHAGHYYLRTTVAIESSDSPAPVTISRSLRVQKAES